MARLGRQLFIALALASALAFASAAGSGASGPPAGKRIALDGFDPVAYFWDGEPIKGTMEFWSVYDGAVYLFRSEDHRAAFAADPNRFAPQFAGFCAGGMAQGTKIKADPQAWVIADGKLFVFYAAEGVVGFKRDQAAMIEHANANWLRLKDQQ